MSKAKVIVLSVVEQGLSKAEAARRFGVSWQWVHTLVRRYEADGLDGVEPRSRRPRTNPRTTPETVQARIIELRRQLVSGGLDAGPATIAWHLQREGIDPPPAISTIRRVLLEADLIQPEPRKRPRASLHRFEAVQPNETWQSDFTHWTLIDGTDVQILAWLDDHSRFLVSLTAHAPVTGTDVVDTFAQAINSSGPPASTLTDNGAVYTTRRLGDRSTRNAFEHLIAALGITQKNGSPWHPQTQGKVERFWQTLKRWLDAQPLPADIPGTQHLLDTFRDLYNHHRPHRAIDRLTPAQAYTALPKARPTGTAIAGYYRVRFDHVDPRGKISLRRAGTMHHLGIIHAHKAATILITDDAGPAVDSGIPSPLRHADPTHTCWHNKEREPGRWPNSRT